MFRTNNLSDRRINLPRTDYNICCVQAPETWDRLYLLESVSFGAICGKTHSKFYHVNRRLMTFRLRNSQELARQQFEFQGDVDNQCGSHVNKLQLIQRSRDILKSICDSHDSIRLKIGVIPIVDRD